MTTSRLILPAALALATAAQVEAQQLRAPEERERRPQPRVLTLRSSDEDRPRIGVSTGPGGTRDTLGLLVTDVTSGGPAAKAGVEEGDRLQAINGVSLRLAAADVEDEEMLGIGTRRLVRELGKSKVGDTVDLRVYREGQVRSVKLTTVSAESLRPERRTVAEVRRDTEDRATIGIGLGASGSRRDTLGILIASVTDDGPADKARIEEGDRIAAINGVDTRVPAADAGDWTVSNSRMRRVTRALDKLKAGDEVELRLIRGGQARTVRVKTVAAKDLPGRDARAFFTGDGGFGFSFGDGDAWRALEGRMPALPRILREGQGSDLLYFDRLDDGDVRLRLSPERRAMVEEQISSAMSRLRDARVRVRPRVEIR
ncbi:MAG: PDZ domain-containing protein [Gemmatimonadaceae bacterium]|nr:PDZ domain-containing protein [Gemmatimonadaceae bacterium]